MKFTFIILGSGVNNKIAMGIVYKYVKFNQTYKIKRKKRENLLVISNETLNPQNLTERATE